MNAPIAQLDRVTVYETVGYKFDSCWVRFLFSHKKTIPPKNIILFHKKNVY